MDIIMGGIEKIADRMCRYKLNRMISRIEYGDTTETYVAKLAQICEQSVFQWREAVLYYQSRALKQKLDEEKDLLISRFKVMKVEG